MISVATSSGNGLLSATWVTIAVLSRPPKWLSGICVRLATPANVRVNSGRWVMTIRMRALSRFCLTAASISSDDGSNQCTSSATRSMGLSTLMASSIAHNETNCRDFRSPVSMTSAYRSSVSRDNNVATGGVIDSTSSPSLATSDSSLSSLVFILSSLSNRKARSSWLMTGWKALF